MHRCLYISEILQEIFEYSATESLAPLVHLAGTCRLFYEPALDILWRELDDFGPLIKCMPENTWTEEATIVGESQTFLLVSSDLSLPNSS